MTFDAMAATFDTQARAERAKAVAAAIRARIGGPGLKTAIEYGCGTGLVGLCLLDLFDELWFVDSSPAMLGKVDEKIASQGVPNARTLCADFARERPGLSADVIFMSLVLHHIPDTPGILSRMHGALHPGGRLIVVDIDPDGGAFHANHPGYDGHNGFDQSALAAQMRSAGFLAVESRTFFAGDKSAGGRENAYSLFIMDAVKA